jgi:hypothetical protein
VNPWYLRRTNQNLDQQPNRFQYKPDLISVTRGIEGRKYSRFIRCAVNCSSSGSGSMVDGVLVSLLSAHDSCTRLRRPVVSSESLQVSAEEQSELTATRARIAGLLLDGPSV